MSTPIVLPPLDEAQAASWHAMMELYGKVPENWTLIGGQLVHLHCAERDTYPTRPTTDVDTVINIRQIHRCSLASQQLSQTSASQPTPAAAATNTDGVVA